MIAATQLQLVLVTPETTLLDKPVTSMQFPLFDGQIGVLPGRAPLVGRLGTGELRFETADGTERFFIEGGFAQIKGSVVTLLTSRAVIADAIDAAKVEELLESAQNLRPTTDEGFAEKQQSLDSARAQLAIKKRI